MLLFLNPFQPLGFLGWSLFLVFHVIRKGSYQVLVDVDCVRRNINETWKFLKHLLYAHKVKCIDVKRKPFRRFLSSFNFMVRSIAGQHFWDLIFFFFCSLKCSLYGDM